MLLKKISIAFLFSSLFILASAQALVCDSVWKNMPFYRVGLKKGVQAVCQYGRGQMDGYYYGATYGAYIISGPWKEIDQDYYICAGDANQCVFGIKNFSS